MSMNGTITRNPPAPAWISPGAWRAVSTDYRRRIRPRKTGLLAHLRLTLKEMALWLTGGGA